MFVNSFGGVGVLTSFPPPQPVKVAAASNIKVIMRFSIDSSPFSLLA
ncbi:hypothetical protein [Paraburkholderia fungorum]|nr:hypothetical protein [Paraburkholderia fungorum]